MKIKATTGNSDLATVYIAEVGDGRIIEFVESVQPPYSREEKWVLIVSTLAGCPVGCRMCDAGDFYRGKLTREDILAQIDYLVDRRYPDRQVPAQKFKIQFARMGDPAFNRDVLAVLEELPSRYDAPGLVPSLSTIAPCGTDRFFAELLTIKTEYYNESFQLQFSIHTTDKKTRDWLMPVKKWSFAAMADYGDRFCATGGKKISLNFAIGNGLPINSEVLLGYFDPQKFLIKITPVNPTYTAQQHNLCSGAPPSRKNCPAINELGEAGYDVILSIGELEENRIGSNCGQYITNYLKTDMRLQQSYTHALKNK
jgi:23S rRNA (adenine2503-C2)-methyltransferase